MVSSRIYTGWVLGGDKKSTRMLPRCARGFIRVKDFTYENLIISFLPVFLQLSSPVFLLPFLQLSFLQPAFFSAPLLLS